MAADVVGTRMRRDLLAAVPVLAAVPPGDLEALAQHAQRSWFRRGQVIFQRDDAGTSLHIVEQGHVYIVLPSPEGEEMIVAVLGPGEFFGDLSLLDGAPRCASAVAADPVSTFVVRREPFLSWLESRPSAARAVMAALARRLRATDEMLGDAAFLDIDRRLAKKLLQLCGRHGKGEALSARVTQDELAAMLGLTRECINKHLGQLRDRGLIEVGRGSIRLLCADGLAQLT